MTTKPPDGQATDVGSLWEYAVIKYCKKTNHNLSHLKAASIAEVKAAADRESESFSHFRHNNEKVAKVRSAVGGYLDAMEKCVGIMTSASTSASAFPPAIPVNIVFAATGRVLSVCALRFSNI